MEVEAIRNFVLELLRNKGESDDVGNGDSLLATGLLDSMDVLEIITYLESEGGLDLTDQAFDPGAFDTIDGIVAFSAE